MNRYATVASCLLGLGVLAFGGEPPAAKDRPSAMPNSVVRELAKNPDGTVLVAVRPRFWQSELGCEILADERGREFPNIYTLLTFRIGGADYSAKWRSRRTQAPAELDERKEYRMLLRPGKEEWCMILRVWEGDKLLVDQTGASK